MSDLTMVKNNALELAAAEELKRMSESWSTATASRSWHLTKLGAGFVQPARDYLARFSYQTYYPMTYRSRALPQRKLSHAQRKAAHLFKQSKREPLLRGYLFVRLDVRADRWHGVFREAGIYGIACAGDVPYPADAIVTRLMAREAADGAIPGTLLISDVFQVGELVRVEAGPFSGFNATVAEVGEDGLLKVLIELLGRSTRVTLDFCDCEKV